MLKVGLIGIGFMGRTHLRNYMRMEEEGVPVKLAAICDIDPDKFNNIFIKGNIGKDSERYDFSKYRCYTDIDKMLEEEKLDYVDICLPTYLHAEASIKALNRGFHVLCEKPMALNTADCKAMIDASEKNGKKLMIGQCLRFWPEYEYLKDCVDDKRYGEVTCGYFFRGGSTPVWSYENWLQNKERSGGCLLDQHIHDVDTIHWLFGKPEKVTTSARNIIPGSGYDALSTNYLYQGGMVINAQDDWTLNGKVGFHMIFRVNFEKASLHLTKEGLTVFPHEGDAFVPEVSPDKGYYREIRYFIDSIQKDTKIAVATPESTMETIRIAEAELLSADRQGELVKVQ